MEEGAFNEPVLDVRLTSALEDLDHGLKMGFEVVISGMCIIEKHVGELFASWLIFSSNGLVLHVLIDARALLYTERQFLLPEDAKMRDDREELGSLIIIFY